MVRAQVGARKTNSTCCFFYAPRGPDVRLVHQVGAKLNLNEFLFFYAATWVPTLGANSRWAYRAIKSKRNEIGAGWECA